jgi:hypothetical protein
MPSTDTKPELTAKASNGSARLTAGCVCQWVNSRNIYLIIVAPVGSIVHMIK